MDKKTLVSTTGVTLSIASKPPSSMSRVWMLAVEAEDEKEDA